MRRSGVGTRPNIRSPILKHARVTIRGRSISAIRYMPSSFTLLTITLWTSLCPRATTFTVLHTRKARA